MVDQFDEYPDDIPLSILFGVDEESNENRVRRTPRLRQNVKSYAEVDLCVVGEGGEETPPSSPTVNKEKNKRNGDSPKKKGDSPQKKSPVKKKKQLKTNNIPASLPVTEKKPKRRGRPPKKKEPESEPDNESDAVNHREKKPTKKLSPPKKKKKSETNVMELPVGQDQDQPVEEPKRKKMGRPPNKYQLQLREMEQAEQKSQAHEKEDGDSKVFAEEQDRSAPVTKKKEPKKRGRPQKKETELSEIKTDQQNFQPQKKIKKSYVEDGDDKSSVKGKEDGHVVEKKAQKRRDRTPMENNPENGLIDHDAQNTTMKKKNEKKAQKRKDRTPKERNPENGLIDYETQNATMQKRNKKKAPKRKNRTPKESNPENGLIDHDAQNTTMQKKNDSCTNLDPKDEKVIVTLDSGNDNKNFRNKDNKILRNEDNSQRREEKKKYVNLQSGETITDKTSSKHDANDSQIQNLMKPDKGVWANKQPLELGEKSNEIGPGQVQAASKPACGSEKYKPIGSDSSRNSPMKDLSTELPSIQQLYKSPHGLLGFFWKDKYCKMNLEHGSNSTIVLNVLKSLMVGKLPHVMKKEIPFLRPIHDIMTKSSRGGGPPVSRFYGVVRFDNLSHEFAIECPRLRILEPDGKMTLPENMRARGQNILFRACLDEFVAGQLYVFIVRLLYGKAAVDAIHEQCKASKDHIEEILLSFGARKMANC